tara:strand:- start:160 stop:2322 length:2163 start_codon:yes stop_codon:yes gene_type:complete
MALPDLTGQNIQDTYQRVLQKSGSGDIVDGTGSLFLPPSSSFAITSSHAISASHEITYEISSSYAETASFANDFTVHGTISASKTSTASFGSLQTYGELNPQGDIVLEQGKGIRGQFDAFDFDETFIVNNSSNGVIFGFKDRNTILTGSTVQAKAMAGDVYYQAFDEIKFLAGTSEGNSTSNLVIGRSGDITASGDISSSGTIIGSNLSGTNTGDQDLSSYSTLAHLNASGSTLQTNIDAKAPINNASFTGTHTVANLTASGNISGSKIGTISAGSGSYHVLQGDTSKATALYIDGHITSSGNISSSGTIVAKKIKALGSEIILENGHITASGDISASGVFRMGLPGARQEHYIYGKLNVMGSDVVIGDGHITASGNISASAASTASFSHIITSGDTIEFKNGGSQLGTLRFDDSTGFEVKDSAGDRAEVKVGRVGALEGGTIDLRNGHITASGYISASNGVYAHGFYGRSDSRIYPGGTGAGFIGANVSSISINSTSLTVDNNINLGGHITASGNISSSGGVVKTSRLSGGATGDQSGSLYLSGSLTFQSNEAIPAVSASTLYNNNGHLYYGKGLIGGYHLSASADNVGTIKILSTGWMNNDDSGTYQRVLFEDGTGTGPFGSHVSNVSHELYKAVDIPAGWTATKYQIYCANNRTTDFIVVDMTDGTGTTDGTSGTCNTECTLNAPYTPTSTNYALIRVTTTSTTDFVFGGYIIIERR